MPRLVLILLLSILFAGCATQSPAPVIDRSSTGVAAPAATEVQPGYYAVKKGDTLYRIALDHGQDYKDVVAWNNLENPNRIEIGQQLRIAPPEGSPVAVAKPVTGSAPVEVKPVTPAAVPPAPTICQHRDVQA